MLHTAVKERRPANFFFFIKDTMMGVISIPGNTSKSRVINGVQRFEGNGLIWLHPKPIAYGSTQI